MLEYEREPCGKGESCLAVVAAIAALERRDFAGLAGGGPQVTALVARAPALMLGPGQPAPGPRSKTR